MTTPLATLDALEHQPISNILWVHHSRIAGNPWNPNRVHKPELKLLEQSLLLTGWVQPLLVSIHPDPDAPEDYRIIDGFHRWMLSKTSQKVLERYAGLVPVASLDLTDEEAMLLTVRINRAKGSHASTLMSVLVRTLLERGVTRQRIQTEMGATALEVDLLAAEDVFKTRGTAEWAYSPSWYPIEDGRTSEQSRAGEPAGIPDAVDGDS